MNPILQHKVLGRYVFKCGSLYFKRKQCVFLHCNVPVISLFFVLTVLAFISFLVPYESSSICRLQGRGSGSEQDKGPGLQRHVL